MYTTKDRPETDFKGEVHRPSVTDVARQQVVARHRPTETFDRRWQQRHASRACHQGPQLVTCVWRGFEGQTIPLGRPSSNQRSKYVS